MAAEQRTTRCQQRAPRQAALLPQHKPQGPLLQDALDELAAEQRARDASKALVNPCETLMAELEARGVELIAETRSRTSGGCVYRCRLRLPAVADASQPQQQPGQTSTRLVRSTSALLGGVSYHWLPCLCICASALVLAYPMHSLGFPARCSLIAQGAHPVRPRSLCSARSPVPQAFPKRTFMTSWLPERMPCWGCCFVCCAPGVCQLSLQSLARHAPCPC